MTQIVKDPVCGMMVAEDSFPFEYLKLQFSFCSEQCQNRFEANPHLYIGTPGAKAPKQEGVKILKRRRFALENRLSDVQGEYLQAELCSMMGIRDVQISGSYIEITYDLLQATAEQVESRIQSIGHALGQEWGERLRRGFMHFLEEIEISSLEVPPPRDGHGH